MDSYLSQSAAAQQGLVHRTSETRFGRVNDYNYVSNNLSDSKEYELNIENDLEHGIKTRIESSFSSKYSVSNFFDISDNHILFEFISKSQYNEFVKYWNQFYQLISKHSKNLRILLAIFLFLFAIFFYWNYGSMFTIQNIQKNHSNFVQFIEINPYLAPFTYILICIIVVGLTIPGATVLCMASGLFFKQPYASFYAWLGCDTGAILCFILVRAICKDCLKSKVTKNSKMFCDFERGLRKNEFSFLIYVRFIIIVPFWFVNVSAALLGASFKTFVLSTFIATLPGSMILTTAGRSLNNIIEISTNDKDISTFSLIVNAMWTKDMQYCLILLIICLIISVSLKYYNNNNNNTNNNNNYNYNSYDESSAQNKFIKRVINGTKLNETKIRKLMNLDNIKWSRHARKME